VHRLFASLLEALGPLTILGAQAVYLGGPVLGGTVASNRLQALADMLEDPNQTKAFIGLLRR
jgi:hypothetical protein